MEVTITRWHEGTVRTALNDSVVTSILWVLHKPHVSPVPIAPAAFPLLNSIDPYGVTVFNSYQMQFFLEEWNRLEPTLDPKERDGWAIVRSAAEEVAANNDYFLMLVGD